MLGGLPYMTPLRVTNPQNRRSVILYKRDIGAGQPLSNTLGGYHYRIDLTAVGVDANAPVGTPIYAPLDSQLVELVGDWYAGQPLLLFRFLNRPAGAASAYWYVAEEITPVSTTIGTIFRARQDVARFAPTGTGIELGWGSPTFSGRTLAQQMRDSAAANPPAGAQTTWGESFKHFFGIH